MPTTVQKVRVFVASPGDLADERDRLKGVVEELNRTIAPKNGIMLELVRWETHVAPDMGRPQGVINRQVGDQDIFIGIMWKRFGTPTGVAASGTQEEFQIAYDSWKTTHRPRIMFYFNQTPLPISNIGVDDLQQFQRVVEFRKQFNAQGLSWDYQGPDDFERIVRGHITEAIWEVIAPTSKVKAKGNNNLLQEQPELEAWVKWGQMSYEDRARAAREAVDNVDADALWSLIDAWLRSSNRGSSNVARSTSTAYKAGLGRLLNAWKDYDLLQPPPDAAAKWVYAMTHTEGITPGTIQGRLSAGRALYAALRWCGVVAIDPFADIRTKTNKSLNRDPREPYTQQEISTLMGAVTNPFDRVLILLGAHAGLRAAEASNLRWSDINSAGKKLVVRRGRGGKSRTVTISKSLMTALNDIRQLPTSDFILPWRSPASSWRHLQLLCGTAKVPSLDYS